MATVGMIVGVMALAVLAFWIINNFAASDAVMTGVADPLQQVDRLLETQNWHEAVTAVETAGHYSPNELNLLVWDAGLAQKLGATASSQTSLSPP